MAKTPKIVAPADLSDDFTKLFGGNDEEATVTHFLTTGYAELDFALSSRYQGGGLPGGRIVEIAGPPSSGKTAIATAAMAQALRQGGIAAFNDHERSFSLNLALKTEPLFSSSRFIYKKPRTFEDSLALCIQVAKHVRENKLIHADAPICWVFDSLAAMVPRSVLFDEKGNERPLTGRNMNDNTALSRATSAAMPAFSMLCEELGVCAIFLNQVRTKIGVVYGDPRTTPGGDAPKFYASVRMMLNAAAKVQKAGAKAGDAPIAMQITAAVNKNKVSRPFLTASWRFAFNEDGTGKFDVARSTLDFLLKTGALKYARPGFIEWEGVQRSTAALAELIEATGQMEKLIALLPANYEPETVDPDSMVADLLATTNVAEAA